MRRTTETGIGGPHGKFPETQWSIIQGLRSETLSDRNSANELLIRLYWKPVYKYLRIKWGKSNEDAKDLTQAFFMKTIEKDYFRNYDPKRARFRTYLRTCLDGFIANEEKAARAQKRGGDYRFLPLDFHTAEVELTHNRPSPEECFEKEWIRSLFSTALEDLKALCETTGKQIHFQLFEKLEVERDPSVKVTYADLAGEYSISVTSVTNYLAFTRREFRRLVLERLRQTTGGEEEFRGEYRKLFGKDL